MRPTTRKALPAAIGVLASLAIAGPATSRPVVNAATPAATLSNCDKRAQTLTLTTVQTSTSRADRLQQRYIGQYREGRGGHWVTFTTTEWRDIDNESRTVRSSTVFDVQGGAGRTYRYRVQFRWIAEQRSKTVPRLTRAMNKPVPGKGTCRL